MTVCTWVPPCASPAEHIVWREARFGLVVHEAVCSDHLAHARRRGYRTDPPPIPPLEIDANDEP